MNNKLKGSKVIYRRFQGETNESKYEGTTFKEKTQKFLRIEDINPQTKSSQPIPNSKTGPYCREVGQGQQEMGSPELLKGQGCSNHLASSSADRIIIHTAVEESSPAWLPCHLEHQRSPHGGDKWKSQKHFPQRTNLRGKTSEQRVQKYNGQTQPSAHFAVQKRGKERLGSQS